MGDPRKDMYWTDARKRMLADARVAVKSEKNDYARHGQKEAPNGNPSGSAHLLLHYDHQKYGKGPVPCLKLYITVSVVPRNGSMVLLWKKVYCHLLRYQSYQSEIECEVENGILESFC